MASTTSQDQSSSKTTKAASLTLSQRRALLRLSDEGLVVPATAFKALPLEHLASVGYAKRSERKDGTASFKLTKKGQERAAAINPLYRDWSAGETVVAIDEDGNPTTERPVAGTHRAAKVEDVETPEVEAPVEA